MMRKKRNSCAMGPRAAARIFAGGLALSLVQPSEAAAQSACGKYISGGPDYPASGTLLGSQGFSFDLGFGFRLTFSVGTYRMHDGSNLHVSCGFW
ncbi:hypothetical protein [Candidatus Palauibacter polyketidifaciens]|uniref:hypothetical protein n=1 Tax=Candidatus Palauibacter polyketidifaciens TaxID=3056740 RepID=UPI0023A28840|nr:hypothetical protein [Candidatus Palauibacter polyketidifaciens]MDE2720317.1 hypothetical protein [Candidatus Palauibacter polyketidifaciens]